MQESSTRRNFLKTIGLAAASQIISPSSFARRTAPRRPNILIIHTDEHRIDCLGAYGNVEIKTPHIGTLIADGIRYDNSFCPFPVCTPSRYSLLCGQYVHEHHGWTNRCTLAPHIDTFPKILRTAGYRTKAVGKMHFTPTYLDMGFSELLLAEQDGPGRWDDDYHRYLMRHGLVDHNDLEDQLSEYRKYAPKKYWNTCGALVSNLPENHDSTTWIADKVMETLESWTDQGSQLLMAGFIRPHHPFNPPSPWYKMYDPEKLSLLPGWTGRCLERDFKFSRGYFPNDKLTEAILKKVMAYYYSMISQIDYHVGRMIELLRKKGLYDDTLIIFTADHGDFIGFHHMLLKGNYMYDPVVKVPLIVKWPGNAQSGTVSHRMVNNIDLAPALCRAAGCKPGPQMHGHALQDQNAGHDLIFAEANGGRQIMARSKNRKLILAAPTNENLFFDLDRDPLEMDNLYESPQYRDEIKSLETSLLAWRHKNANLRSYQDHNAPKIHQPNVPPHDLSHREAIVRYYRKKCWLYKGTRDASLETYSLSEGFH